MPPALPYQGGPAPSSPNNNMAVASMVTGIVGLVLQCLCWPVGLVAAFAAVILGVIALRQLGERGGGGRGFAIAGIATGAIGLVIALVLLALVGVAMTTSSFD